MYDYRPELVEKLETVLPTYYELFLDTSTEIPCISYQEIENNTKTEADNLRYSRIDYYVKIWVKDLALLATYLQQVDNIMFENGFTRIAYNEMLFDENICGICRYSGLAKEKPNVIGGI